MLASEMRDECIRILQKCAKYLRGMGPVESLAGMVACEMCADELDKIIEELRAIEP